MRHFTQKYATLLFNATAESINRCYRLSPRTKLVNIGKDDTRSGDARVSASDELLPGDDWWRLLAPFHRLPLKAHDSAQLEAAPLITESGRWREAQSFPSVKNESVSIHFYFFWGHTELNHACSLPLLHRHSLLEHIRSTLDIDAALGWYDEWYWR